MKPMATARGSPRWDALQPALLDRLLGREGGTPLHALSRAEVRTAILRDLGWLLNAVQALPPEQALAHPAVAQSVLNFGLPPLAGEMASRIDVRGLERAIHEAIVRFEPRIDRSALDVRALPIASRMDTHNVLEFEISARVWAQPVPVDVLLRTRLDLEAGKVEISEPAGVAIQGSER